MNRPTHAKPTVLLSPGKTIATEANAVTFIDRADAQMVRFRVVTPIYDGTNATQFKKLKVVKASSSASTAESNWTDVANFTGHTATDGTNAFLIGGPTATGEQGAIHILNVDCRNSDANATYIGLVVDANNTTANTVYADVEAFRSYETPAEADQGDVVVTNTL